MAEWLVVLLRHPVEVAIERLAKLATSGTSAARVDRATRTVVADWRAVQEPDIVRRWIGELQSDVVAGLTSAEEQAGDIDASDTGAAKHAKTVVAALVTARFALEDELALLSP